METTPSIPVESGDGCASVLSGTQESNSRPANTQSLFPASLSAMANRLPARRPLTNARREASARALSIGFQRCVNVVTQPLFHIALELRALSFDKDNRGAIETECGAAFTVGRDT